jgi:putative nucleotidyltransferase DUF294
MPCEANNKKPGCFGPTAPAVMEQWLCPHCKQKRSSSAPLVDPRGRRNAVVLPRAPKEDPLTKSGAYVHARRDSIVRMENAHETGEQLQRAWTERVKKIVEFLYAQAWTDGKPPGDFAFGVCGSGARQQACPYSDLDSFIVTRTDDAAVLQKFDAASEKVKDFLEAINAADSTVAGKGFIFCNGGLNPLSKTGKGGPFIPNPPRLTTTPKNFAAFLEAFHSDPRGLKLALGGTKGHIADGLQEAAFAFGDESLFGEFVREVDLVMGKTCNGFASRPSVTRKKHMGIEMMSTAGKDEFKLPEGNQASFDVKKHFLRMPQFALKALTYYYDIPEVDAARQVADLQQGRRLHERTGKMLLHLLEVPQRIRVRAHLQMHGENDKICFDAYKGADKDKHYVLTQQEAKDITQCLGELKILQKMIKEFLVQKQKSWGSRKNPFKLAPESIR